jgi:hypothetical protein
MTNSPSPTPDIRPDKEYVRQLDSTTTLIGRVSPCVFMTANYPLQISVQLMVNGEFAGYSYASDPRLTATTARDADVEALLAAIRLLPCIRCNAPTIDPSTAKTNRAGLCEGCFMRDLREQFDRESRAEERRIVLRDRRMKAKGLKYRVSAWIHPAAGEDYSVDWYEKALPSGQDVERQLRKLQSIVFDDYQVVKL